MKNKQVKQMMCDVLLSVTPQADKVIFSNEICHYTNKPTGRQELIGRFFNFHTQSEYWSWLFNDENNEISIKASELPKCKKITHRPKGSMCIGCRFAREFAHCDDLNFTKMKAIDKDSDGVIVVKCDFYEKAKGDMQ